MKKPDIKAMTLREKIAQTLLVRQSDLMLRADRDYKEARGAQEAAEIMKKQQFGGLWVHGNVDVNGIDGSLDTSFHFTSQTYRKWLDGIKPSLTYPLLCANDAAGIYSYSDVSDYAMGMIVGAADSEALSYRLGACIGQENRLVGCRWLWTPVVDLFSPFSAEITRTFSCDAETLTRHAVAFIRGMQSKGVAACAKHFPGREPSDPRDNHVVTAKINSSVDEWMEKQGKIFKAMIDEAGVYTIMSGATAFPAVDGDTKNGRYLPSGLSYNIITGLLKGKLGFSGVVISDDVTMGGYTSFYERDDLYVELLKAGNDVLLGVGVDAVEVIEKGVADGRLSEERIDDACRRVLALKEKLGLFDETEDENMTMAEACAETARVQQEIARRGVTLVRNTESFLPVAKEHIKHVTIIAYSHSDEFLPRLEAMKKSFEARGAKVDLRGKLENFTDIQNVAAKSDLIVYAALVSFHCPKGQPGFYDDVFWALRYAYTLGREKSVGVAFGYPYIDYDFMDDACTFVNAYMPSCEIQESFVAGVYGEQPFMGKPPYDVTRMGSIRH